MYKEKGYGFTINLKVFDFDIYFSTKDVNKLSSENFKVTCAQGSTHANVFDIKNHEISNLNNENNLVAILHAGDFHSKCFNGGARDSSKESMMLGQWAGDNRFNTAIIMPLAQRLLEFYKDDSQIIFMEDTSNNNG